MVGIDPDAVPTDALAADVLERFYAWLLRTYGRERRTTAVAYAAEVRAFFRFLDRRRWLHPDLSYERMKDGLRELIGRVQYKTPRVDRAAGPEWRRAGHNLLCSRWLNCLFRSRHDLAPLNRLKPTIRPF